MKSWAEKFMKMQPITDAQRRYFIKETAQFIFVNDKDGNAECTRCNAKMTIPMTKHLQKRNCPSCGKVMTVHHTWRTQRNPEACGWHCIAKAIDNHTICLRYINVFGNEVTEKGRIFIDEYRTDMEFWCNSGWQKEWTKGKHPFFVTPNVFNGYGTEVVYEAKPYMRTWFAECNKLDCFNEYNPIEKVYDKRRMPSQMHYLIRSAKVNEMLRNCGMGKMADEHLGYYMYRANDHSYPVNNKKTTLNEVLKLSKNAFKLWKTNPSIELLKLYQKWEKKFGAEKVNEVVSKTKYYWETDIYLTNLSKAIKITNKSIKTIENYIAKEKIGIADYVDYLQILQQLNYSFVDKQYIMPRDFAKDKRRVCDELNEMKDIKLAESKTAESKVIKLISDGLRKMPELSQFMNGSNGLLVYVPDSAMDLMKEGRALHNCLTNYTERIAKGKTLVFFIRQLDNPTAPFVAMEYCNGSIIQCRYNNNVDVRSKDDETSKKIINFAEAFANKLKEANILAA